MVYSDASASGCGGYIVKLQGQTSYRTWCGNEHARSSTHRELLGVITVLESFPCFLRSQTIKWYTDNQGVVAIVNKGSMKPDLQILAVRIFKFCRENCISIQMEWLPREQNQGADTISKINDTDDWSVTKDFFDYMNKMWGPVDIDRFASYKHHHLTVFYSKYYTPGSSGVDAFAYNWKGVNNWWAPPVKDIIMTLKHIHGAS